MTASTAILVVDDNESFRALAKKMLEKAGFTVAEASTGTEAKQIARRIKPRIVLLDIQLPDIDGFEVARALAGRAGRSHGPVIVLTSTRDASDYGGRIAKSPAAAFVPKDRLSGAVLRELLPQEPSG